MKREQAGRGNRTRARDPGSVAEDRRHDMYTGERTGNPPKLVSKTKLLRSFLVGSVLE